MNMKSSDPIAYWLYILAFFSGGCKLELRETPPCVFFLAFFSLGVDRAELVTCTHPANEFEWQPKKGDTSPIPSFLQLLSVRVLCVALLEMAAPSSCHSCHDAEIADSRMLLT
eukprot:2780127-Amphidinium_carterae.1